MLFGIKLEDYTRNEQLTAAKKILFGKKKSKVKLPKIKEDRIKITDDLLRNAISEHRYKKSDFVRYAGKNHLSKQIQLRWLSKNGVKMDTILNPYNNEFIEPQEIVDYILQNPSNKRKGYLNGIKKKRKLKVVEPTLCGLENINKVESKDIISLSTSGELGKFLNAYENNEYSVVIKGDKGAGKSRLLHQCINLFADLGKKIAFLSLEMDKSTAIAQSLVKEYITVQNQAKILCTSDNTTIEDLIKIAESGKFEVIAIDSFNKIKDFNQKNFEELRKKYPKIIWLVIFQSTTGKVIRGGNMPEYDCSVVIQINTGGDAVLEKNRYGETVKGYNVFTKKIKDYGNKKTSDKT